MTRRLPTTTTRASAVFSLWRHEHLSIRKSSGYSGPVLGRNVHVAAAPASRRPRARHLAAYVVLAALSLVALRTATASGATRVGSASQLVVAAYQGQKS